METQTEPVRQADATDKLIEICGAAKDAYVRQILLGASFKIDSDDVYRAELEKLNKRLRKSSTHRINMIQRVVNLAFLYIISKYTSMGVDVTSNCEARINNAVGNLYNSYNASDDVVQYIILNVALGLDASDKFKNKFELIAGRNDFYTHTDEYINIFNRLQKLRSASSNSKILDTVLPELLYKLAKKVGFICDLKILPSPEFADPKSDIVPCMFELEGKTYPSKYALVADRTDGYDRFLFLRSIDEFTSRTGEKLIRLNYTDIGSDEKGESVYVTVVTDDDYGFDRVVRAESVGMLYSFITGDLLRKRHRMSFCNGLSSYKYYGELVASVMDALEMIAIAPDKRMAVIENYIMPVIQSNFNICKEECVCSGTGCRYKGERPCKNDRRFEAEKDLTAHCVGNMDIVSVLTILFSVVGCKEILPQLFGRFEGDPDAFDTLFDHVNGQLEKRFSEFKSERVKQLRDKFYEKSIEYLSLNIDESKYKDAQVAQSLKPFRIRAYTDALLYVLENLDCAGAENKAGPIGNVYGMRNKIELISGIKNIEDVRATLRDSIKVILAYYSGLSSCKQQQLGYEVRAEQTYTLSPREIADYERDIKDAFFAGVDNKLGELGKLGVNPSFYDLFKMLKSDNDRLKGDISVMLGREMINVRALEQFVKLDDVNKRCYLVSQRGGDVYKCDLDDEAQCAMPDYRDVFVARVVELLNFFNGESASGIRFACYPQVLTHTSSRVNMDNTTISEFTTYESERGSFKKEYNVITYFKYEISKRYFYVAPKKFEKTRWIIYPILIRCSEFYDRVFGGKK